MKQLFPRGKRIRPTDKDLVFHTALAALFPVFLLVVLLFHPVVDFGKVSDGFFGTAGKRLVL